MESVSYLILYNFDFYYLMPFPVDKILMEGEGLRPKLVRKDIKLFSWILPDDDLIWKVKPGINIRAENINCRSIPSDECLDFTISTNSLGFRTPEFSPVKKDCTLRIVALGDSNVFSWGVDEENSFCGILRKKLRDYKGEVINLGCPGYSSLQGLQLLKKTAVSLNPDILIVWFGDNDNLKSSGLTDRQYLSRNHTFAGKLGNLLFRRSYTFRLLFKIYYEKFHLPYFRQANVFRVPEEEFRENLTHIVHICRRNNIRPILLLHLSAEDVYQQIASSVAHDEGCPFISVRELFRENTFIPSQGGAIPSPAQFESGFIDDWIIPLDGHPTLRGHKLIADKLFTIIENETKYDRNN